MKTNLWLKIAGVFVSLLIASIARSQTNDSNVNLEADVAGLSRISPTDVPDAGTFWVVTADNSEMIPPYPMLPLNLPSGNIYVLPDGSFLVDGTVGDRGVTSDMQVTELNSVSNVIQQAETVATRSTPSMSRMRAMDETDPTLPDDGDDDTSGDVGSFFAPDIQQQLTTNDLWLEFQTVSNLAAYVVIHPPFDTNSPYYSFDVFATTNLLSNVPGLNTTN